MKKILTGLCLLFVPMSVFALGTVWQSSYTATADSTKSLCSDVGAGNRNGVLHNVCVGDSAGSGTISIYNAYSTAVNPIAVIRSTAAIGNCLNFDVLASSGLIYSNSTANSITITYQCD